MDFSKFSTAAPPSSLKWMLRSIAFFILMNIGINCYGEYFYYFQYTLQMADKKPLAYAIFLDIGTDGNTTTARIAFSDPVTGKNRMIKLNYVDNDFPDIDNDKISYLMPFGNAFDENDKPVDGFIMPWFQFDKPSTYSMSHAVVKAYVNKQTAPLAGSYREIELKELPAFVKRFYREEEAAYKAMLALPNPGLNAAERATTLYLLAIAATDDPKIGATTMTDLMHLQTVFHPDGIATSAPPALGIKFNYTQISGKDFTKKAVNDALDKLKPRPQDIVIVYYSGHGFRYTDDVSPYPRMALVPSPDKNPATENLAIEEVYNRVLKKGARVTIVLADCCNENYAASPPVGEVQPYVEKFPGVVTLNVANFRALFLPKHRMSLLACAADKNQLAAGNEHLGGFFTNYTANELSKSLFGAAGAGESSWALIINNSKEYTRRQAQTVVCTQGPCDGNGRNLQTPAMKMGLGN